MTETTSITLCGVGGWGESYLRPLLAEAEARNFRLTGIVDPYPENCSLLGVLRERQIPIFPSLEEFFLKNRCDLTILASPIHFHAEQSCLALGRGSHVLCEKPLCVGIEDAATMDRAQKDSGKTVTVGYQWSFSQAIQQFKGDWLAGRFGAARRLRTLVLWPREDKYYRRNSWTGRQRLDSGQLVLDSPVNNAAAHYLHNMFYVLGPSLSESATPKRVQAQLWRAHPIENYDTAALRVETDCGAEILFYASHANRYPQGPSFVYEFERCTAEYDFDQDRLIATFSTGETVDYGSPRTEPQAALWAALESARSGRKPLCGLAAARSHVACVEMAQQSSGTIHDFPSSSIRTEGREGSGNRYVEGLQEIFTRAYSQPESFEALVATMKMNFLDIGAVSPAKSVVLG